MISEFLSRLNIGTNGKALIIHRNGDVIAHPNQEIIKTESEDGALRFANIREIDDPIARAAFGPLAESGSIPVSKETPSQFTYKGARYVSTMMPVISDKLPWTIAVYAPRMISPAPSRRTAPRTSGWRRWWRRSRRWSGWRWPISSTARCAPLRCARR